MNNNDFLAKANELKKQSVIKKNKIIKKSNKQRIKKILNIFTFIVFIISIVGIVLSFAIQDIFEYSGIQALNQISISGVDIASDVEMINFATSANKNAPLLLIISTIILTSCITSLFFINFKSFSKIFKNVMFFKGSKTYINYFFRSNLEKKNEEE